MHTGRPRNWCSIIVFSNRRLLLLLPGSLCVCVTYDPLALARNKDVSDRPPCSEHICRIMLTVLQVWSKTQDFDKNVFNDEEIVSFLGVYQSWKRILVDGVAVLGQSTGDVEKETERTVCLEIRFQSWIWFSPFLASKVDANWPTC